MPSQPPSRTGHCPASWLLEGGASLQLPMPDGPARALPDSLAARAWTVAGVLRVRCSSTFLKTKQQGLNSRIVLNRAQGGWGSQELMRQARVRTPQ